jgi:hypothetical protein
MTAHKKIVRAAGGSPDTNGHTINFNHLNRHKKISAKNALRNGNSHVQPYLLLAVAAVVRGRTTDAWR